MRSFIIALAAMVGLSSAAQADAIIFNGLGTNGPFNTSRGAGDAPLGNVVFSQQTTITRFGVYDAMSGPGTQTFYIFDSNARRLYASAPKLFAGDGSTAFSADSYKVSDPFSFTFAANTSYFVGASANVATGYYVAYDTVTQNGITVYSADNDAGGNGNMYNGSASAGGACCSTGLVFYAGATGTPTAVPEPATLALLGAGLLGLGAARRRR